MSAYNYGGRRSSPTKLYMISWVQGLGGTISLKFERAKTSKIWCYLGKLSSLSAHISGMDEDINKL